MSTSRLTPEQMAKRVARYRDLRPYKDTMNDAHGIPSEAMRMMSPDKVYPIMSPEKWTGRSKIAPVKGEAGLTVSLVECSPGEHAGLHKHTDSVENFFCVEGRFEIIWGERGEHKIELSPLDFVSIPAGVYRDFRNVGDKLGRLFVTIQTRSGDTQDTVVHPAATGDEVTRRFGQHTRDAMAAIGVRFGE